MKDHRYQYCMTHTKGARAESKLKSEVTRNHNPSSKRKGGSGGGVKEGEEGAKDWGAISIFYRRIFQIGKEEFFSPTGF